MLRPALHAATRSRGPAFRTLSLILLAAALAGCGQGNRSSRVELLLGSDTPTPSTTFELRFEDIMVKGDKVGLPAPISPLLIQPPIAGTFTWISSRSGVFTPAEPLALDTKYQLVLSPKLVEADGQRSRATLHWTVATPPFGVIDAWPGRPDTNADSEPEIKLAFNADVSAATAAQFFYFRDESGDRAPADTRQGSLEEFESYPAYEYGADSLQTWNEESAAMKRPGSPASQAPTAESAPDETPNLLVVTPQRALTVGHGWKLIVEPGLPSADDARHSHKQTEVPIGDVTPFEIENVEACNYFTAGPSIQVRFSKPVPESLTNDFRKSIELSFLPTNLCVSVAGRLLTFSGDFKGGTEVTLKLRPGFQAVEPFTLQGARAFTVDVPCVPPRLYFPALVRDQLAEGNRSFPLLSVNIARIRIRAKLMDPHTAIHALRGYASYFISNNQRFEGMDWNEPYRAIDYNVLPGVTVFDKEFDLGPGADASNLAQKLVLRWDEVLNGRRTGVIFLDARAASDQLDPAPGTQALIQLTDLGLVWKKSRSGVDVFVFSHTTGQPVAGATARLSSNENETLRESLTDTNGLAHLAASANADWVAVQLGDDFHALKLDENRAWLYQFDVPYRGLDEPEDLRRVMLFSDRDLYRPGDAMHLEAIVRDFGKQGLCVPPALTGTVQFLDARDNIFYQTNAAFSSLGSWSALVQLPAASRGAYTAQLRFGTNDDAQRYDYGFQVRDFQPSAFEILLPCKQAYAAGERVELPLSANYLFGKPLSRARVTWSLQADDMDFHPDKFESFSFRRADIESRYGRSQSSIAMSGRGVLTGASNFIIAPDLAPNSTAPQPRTVSLLAEVTDMNQQTLSRRVEFVRHSSDFYLGLRQGAQVLDADTPPQLEVVALGTDEKPWPDTINARLTLSRIDWQSVRVQGAGKTIRFRNEPVLTNLFQADIAVDPAPAPKADDDNASGNPLTGLPPLPAGEYVVEVKSADAAGRPVVSSLSFQVTGRDEINWDYRNDLRLALKPDKKAYLPGETAEILLEAPFSGMALVTVEREKVLRTFVTQLRGNAPSIQIPIEQGDVPNVFVSVTLLRGSADSTHRIKAPEYRLGVCELPVLDPQTLLAVEITPASADILPGQPVDVTVRVTDSARRPAPGAEVILYAVDDGILGMTGYGLPDPHGFFYAPRPLSVQTSVSMPNLLEEDPDQLRFENKGFLGGGGGKNRVRKNFLACAFWNASLTSDASGKVRAQFTAPDSLTRYRLFAVVHSADNHFGAGQSAFHVTKPLVIEPALPSFANLTDQIVARGVILNQTTNSGEVLVALGLDDKAKPAGSGLTLEKRVQIPASGSAIVEFPIQFTDVGVSQWLWRAHFADPAPVGFVDAVQSSIQVGHIAPVMGEVLLSRIATSQTNLLALANPQLLDGRGAITLKVANTRLNELGEAATRLLRYPYGCAEQTASSLLPWILLRDAPGMLPLHAGSPADDAGAAIRAGVARLFSMQTSSGGLGYWPHARQPMLWASAYGAMVLALAQRHGIAVPLGDLDSLLKYLSQELRSSGDDSTDISEDCLALYALSLSGRAEPAYDEKLYSLRAKLSMEDQALLALAVAENHGPAEMIAMLLDTRSPSQPSQSPFGCAGRQEAIQLLSWIHYRPEDATVERLVDDLMREQVDAHWETTQENAWALLALTEYARRVEINRTPAAGQIEYAGQTIPFRLDEGSNVCTCHFAISNLPSAPLVLALQTSNRVYTTVSIEARPPELPQPRQDRGLGLQRRYDRLDDDNELRDLAGLSVGDRVLVTLRLTVRRQADYVVIDDALPAILEAVNPEFRTQEARASDLADNENWWMGDFSEIRKDRCLFFADSVEPGNYVLRYVARVRAAGTVTAPPAKAEEMYHPERCGLTESQTLVSKALP